MKQLERRLIKLEAPIANVSELDDLLDEEFEFMTRSELGEFVSALRESAENLTIQQLQALPVVSDMIRRSATRREQYPCLWQIQMSWGYDIEIPKPWSAQRDIEVFRTEIATNWEKRGLALVMDALAIKELLIIEHLRPYTRHAWEHRNCPSSWSRVRGVAALPEIERAVAKVWLDSRATNLPECRKMEEIRWERIDRPLTLADLKLDPATFPHAGTQSSAPLRNIFPTAQT